MAQMSGEICASPASFPKGILKPNNVPVRSSNAMGFSNNLAMTERPLKSDIFKGKPLAWGFAFCQFRGKV